ncbi:hypothetical protein FisN_22Lh071 [Fistulifera solaris]|uniref:Uncharacterized protein n=1 Tax=Fistulifera solaris TaxID=1519565 RepID=A0A1Z5JC86_FISSO|nr:hypothetical protein FisN_22Lh071 [Fistulifera solaris]|eukprot:GAX11398.1 hypothetical protein FisN_22Lh071 [Fistulifera solaris]
MLLRYGLLSTLLAALVSAEIEVDVLGQSGKIMIYDAALGKSDPDRVTMTMDYLHELDENDKVVGKAGSPQQKHSTETFANQRFTYSNIQEVVFSNLTADYLSFDADVYSAGTIKVETYIFKENGTITTSTNETLEVVEGDFKFAIQLIDWNWCDPCADGNATHIDVGVELKGKDDQPTEDDLGGGISVIMSQLINIDGENVAMPDGYPKVITKNGKTLFVFRFPKEVEGGAALYDYDPLITTGGPRAEEDRCGLFCRVCG